MREADLKPAYHHVQELRTRLMVCAGVFLVGGVAGYMVRSPIIKVLERPLGQELFYTSPAGSFDFVMRISCLAGFLIALPVILYHVLRFIEPALPRRLPRRVIAGTILTSWGLMAAGVVFGYYVSLPTALHFFGQVGTGNLQPIITADKYFTFIVNYLAVFAAVFQLPLLLLLANRITPLGPTQMRRYRRYVIAGSFVVALLTPAPDPMSQIILALPIIALYEFSIALLWLVNRRREMPAKVAVEKLPEVAPVPAIEAAAVATVATAAAAPTPAALRRSARPQRPIAPVALAPTRRPAPGPVVIPRPAPRMPAAGRPLDLREAGQAMARRYMPPPANILDLRSAQQ